MRALRSSSWACWTSGRVFFYIISVSILVGGNGNGNDELR